MPDPTQANRRIELITPLGQDVLLVRRASVREQMSRLFQIDLDLISKRNDINFDDIVGKNVTMRLDLPQQKRRFFNGFVNRFVQTKSERSYSVYRASLVPWLWFLTRSADCKIFQASMQEPPDAMTVPGIIKKVFKDHGFEDFRDDGLSASYRTWEFCVQYRETAFNFVSRLMEQEGIGYFFEHEDGKHTLVLADSINAHLPFENYETIPYNSNKQGGRDEETVTDWVVEKEVQPTTYILNDFNFENPRQAAQRGLVVNSTIARQHENAEGQIYDYPGEFLESAEGEALAKLRIEELQARFETAHAHATAMGVSAGYKFTLKSHPRDDQNHEYLITSASLEMDAGEFEAGSKSGSGQHFSSSFTAMDAAQPYRPPRITPKPVIQGVQTAIVVGPGGEEIHTDEHARVKVQFHWDRYGNHDENSSCWIRVSHANAGKGWGSMITPRIGQEVIVEFLEGDPDRPIITGRVYNGDQTPPYADGQGVVSGLKSNTHKGGGYNEMSMDDTAGSEKITVHAQYDMNTKVGHDQTLDVTNNRTDKIGVDDSETVGGTQTIKVTGHRKLTVEGGQDVTITGAHDVKVTGHQKTEIGGGQELKVTGDDVTDVTAHQAVTVGSGQDVTVTGAQKLESTGKQTLKAGGGQDLEVTGKQSLHATGDIEISSDSKIKLTAGGSSIEIGPSGVKINSPAIVDVKGSVVKVNS